MYALSVFYSLTNYNANYNIPHLKYLTCHLLSNGCGVLGHPIIQYIHRLYMHLHGSANRRVTPCYTITQSFLNQPFHRMLSILRTYCDVDADEPYSTRFSWRVQMPGLTLCRLLSVDVECCHNNCFCMLCSSALAHCGSRKMAAVNNTDGSIISFSSIILTEMLVERLAAVASLFLTFRIRKA